MSKANTNKKAEVIVTIRKTGKTIEQTNAAVLAPVDPGEFDTASVAVGTLNTAMALNLIAGKVDQGIKTAASQRGELRKLMPNSSSADINAIKVCLESTPAKLRAGWQAHVDSVKRLHGITLQALAKSVTPKKPAKESFKDRYVTTWNKFYNAEPNLAKSDELEALYMLAIDAGWENPDDAKE